MSLKVVGETRNMLIIEADPKVYGIDRFRCTKDPEKIPDGALMKVVKKGNKTEVVDATDELRKLVKSYVGGGK